MLPFIVGAVALGLLSRGSRDSNPNQLIIELDTALPAPEVEQVIGAIRAATPATVTQIDAMSNAYRQRGMPLTAYELARRAWDVRGRQGPPPQPPHPDAGAPQGLPPTSPPVGCLDAAADPAMCQAVTGALLTETNPDKLHAFAETLRAHFPQAAEALDSKAIVFGWTGPSGGSHGAHANGYANGYANGHANGHAAPYANGDGSQADGAPAPQAPQSWVQVASDMSNVPPQYHGSLATMMMQLGRDDSMAQGSERAVQVGDRMFVFVKPPVGPNVTAGTVWITRMSVGPEQQTAATGYGSGPLWPVDIINGRMIPPDRRIMGSPTIWDPATSILSPPAPVQTMMMQGPPGPPVQEVYVSGEQPPMSAPHVMHPMSGGQMAVGGSMDDGEPMQMSVPGAAMAAAVAAMPPGAAFGDAGVREIMGASRPEIVSSGQAGAEEMAKDAVFIEQQMQAEIDAQMQYAAQMEQAAMQQHAAEVQAAAAAEQASQAPMPDRRAPARPRPSVYVKLKHGDSVWPVKLAKIGSGNKNNYDQLVTMNPHLVSPSGAWRQMFPGDEVCIPPEWAQNLRDRGFLIKSDFEGN